MTTIGSILKPGIRASVLASFAALASLSACGGGADGMEPHTIAPLLTPTQLFNWAESRYPDLFPAGPVDETQVAPTGETLIFRRYRSTRNFVAVEGGKVYIAGPVAGGVGEIREVGQLEDFYCEVTPRNCAAAR
jgi:hypothetical protein